MKKSILIILIFAIGISSIFAYTIYKDSKSKELIFSDSGYILADPDNRYYFSQDEVYKKTYNDQITFKDKEGQKVNIDTDHFLHYSNGSIINLQDSVLLDFNNIDQNPIIYYNVKANTQVKKNSGKFSVKNLNKDIIFENALWKISDNKFIVLGPEILIHTSDDEIRLVKDYLEFSYSDNEIVNLYTQELGVKTISTNGYLELNNDIIIEFGNKLVSKNMVNKLFLNNMVINEDNNVTLESLEDVENIAQVLSKQDLVEETIQGEEEEQRTHPDLHISQDQETISHEFNIQTKEIVYEYVDENEKTIDDTQALSEPEFKLSETEISAIGIKTNLLVSDEDDILSKEDEIYVTIINNSTGKVVYSLSEPYGTFEIPIQLETLAPNTSYTIEAKASYLINDTKYMKNVLYKPFVTNDIGIEFTKNYITNNEFCAHISFKDSLIQKIIVELLDGNGNYIREKIITNRLSDEDVVFNDLKSDTDYRLKVSQITYDGSIRDGSNWIIYLDGRTLKEKPIIKELNYKVSKRENKVDLIIEDLYDPNNSIVEFKYEIYQFVEVIDENLVTTGSYDMNKIIYEKYTSQREISVEFGENKPLDRATFYGFRVIAIISDNEKQVEAYSPICGAFILNGKQFPTVKFKNTQSDYPPTKIYGILEITDYENAIVIDSDNPLIITYFSDVDEEKTLISKYSIDSDQIDVDSDGNTVYRILLNIGDSGNNTNGLKEETSYTFSAYGTLDLRDNNGLYKSSYIGSAIVTTSRYNQLDVSLVSVSNSTNTFTVELSMSGDEISKESLSSIDLLLYEGHGDIERGDYQYWKRTITKSNYASCENNVKNKNKSVNSLQDLVFGNSLQISPSFIGGKLESDYNQMYYQVIVTATLDGTKYSNKIPLNMVEDDNNLTNNLIYKNPETNERYTGCYIMVTGGGTTPEFDPEKQKANGNFVYNYEASSYNLTYDSELDANTPIAIKVGTEFKNSGSMIPTSITYYAWNKDLDPIMLNDQEQLTQTYTITNGSQIPNAIFVLEDDYGDNFYSQLRRGGAYYFSYVIKYKDGNNREVEWPMCMSEPGRVYTNKTLITERIVPQKQLPRFTTYPRNSYIDIGDNNVCVEYNYVLTDPDRALLYQDSEEDIQNDTKNTTRPKLVAKFSNEEEYEFEVNLAETNSIFTIKGIPNGGSYSLNYDILRAPSISEDYETVCQFTQQLGKINDLSNVSISRIEQNLENQPNIVKVYFTGDDVNQLVAIRAVFKKEDDSSVKLVSDYIPIQYDHGYYAIVQLTDMVSHANFDQFVNSLSEMEILAYYTTNRIGFLMSDSTSYITLVNNQNKPLGVGGNNNIVALDNQYGNLYKKLSILEKTESVLVSYQNIDHLNRNSSGSEFSLRYTQGAPSLGFGNQFVIIKEIGESTILQDTLVDFSNIKLGIDVKEILAGINSVSMKMKLINALNAPIDRIHIRMVKCDTAEQTPDWLNSNIYHYLVDDIDNIFIENLEFSSYYYFKVYYSVQGDSVYQPAYSIKTNKVDEIYSFETLTTIGISALKIKKVFTNYEDKKLSVGYSVDEQRSNMYSAMRYTFYKQDETNPDEYIKVNLTENSINPSDSITTIRNGSIETKNTYYKTNKYRSGIERIIYVSPNICEFDFGCTYKIVLEPLAELNGDEIVIESFEKVFTLAELTEPSVGLRISRKEKLDKYYLQISTSVMDPDCIIYGNGGRGIGQYKIEVYKYKDELNEEKIDIYFDKNGNDKATDNYFNIRENGMKFLLYVLDSDYDSEYNYKVNFIAKYDRSNKGYDNTEEVIVSKKISAIENEEGILVGTPVIIDRQELGLELRFYDCESTITKINRIECSIFDMDNVFIDSVTLNNPTWLISYDGNSEIAFSKVDISGLNLARSVYIMKLQLYFNNTKIYDDELVFNKDY